MYCSALKMIVLLGPALNILLHIIIISNSNRARLQIQGVIGRVIKFQNRPSAKREDDLKLRARLLPELYATKSN